MFGPTNKEAGKGVRVHFGSTADFRATRLPNTSEPVGTAKVPYGEGSLTVIFDPRTMSEHAFPTRTAVSISVQVPLSR